MAKRSKSNPLNKMIHMASELQRHAKNMSKKDAPVFILHTAKLADAVRDRLLKGIHGGYNIEGKQFKHHSKFTTYIRQREALGGKHKQFASSTYGDELAYQEAALMETKTSSSKVAKKTSKVGGYTFNAGPKKTILYDGKRPGAAIVDMIGDTLEKSKIIVSEKTSIKLKADSLQKYQILQNEGGNVSKSKFSRRPMPGKKGPRGGTIKSPTSGWNTVGKDIPSRKWFGIPKTYRENHPGWKKAMGILSDDLEKEYGRIIKGKKADLHWYKKSKEGNKKWQDLKKKAK